MEGCNVDGFTAFWMAMVPSIPPTIAAVVGFFAFHVLAVRRQKREEVRQACEALKKEILELTEVCCKCWETAGSECVAGGLLPPYKSKIFSSNAKYSTLSKMDSRFFEIGKQYRLLKVLMDECGVGQSAISIESAKRTADTAYVGSLRNAAEKLGSNIDTKYADLYK